MPHSPSAAKPSALLRLWSILTGLIWWGSIALVIVLILLTLSLYGLLVPRAGQFRPQLEERLTQAVGAPVKIDSIAAHVNGWLPHFELQGVSLLDAQGRQAARVKKVALSLSPHSLLKFGTDQILIEQPELSVRRDKSGKIFVAGLDVSENTEGKEASVATDWLFSQREWVIRGGSVRWKDDLTQAPALVLKNLDLYLRNMGRRHLLRVQATPPANWGKPFSIQGDFTGMLMAEHPGDWQTWDGLLYADFPAVDVAELKKHIRLGFNIEHGRGALRSWLTLSQGKLTDLTLDSHIEQVDLRLRPDLAPVQLRNLQGRITLKDDERNFNVQSQNLELQLPDGLLWPKTAWSLSQEKNADPSKVKTRLKIDKLQLANLGYLGKRLALDQRAHDWLQSLQVQGEVSALSLTTQGAWGTGSELTQYQAEGKIKQLSIAAGKAASPALAQPEAGIFWYPGLRQADLDFKLNQAGGQATLVVNKGSIELQGFFEEPKIELGEAAAQIQWQHLAQGLQVNLPQIRFANADATGEAKGVWRSSDAASSPSRSRYPGILDLNGVFSRLEATKIHRYLPSKIAPEARHYVRDAIIQGQLMGAQFRVKGDLYNMPFAKPELGEFRIAGRMQDAVFDYVPKRLQEPTQPSWPALTQLNGDLIYDRISLTVKDAKTQLANLPEIKVNNLGATVVFNASPTVHLQAQAQASSVAWLDMLRKTPLDNMMGKVLTKTSLTGSNDLALALQLPIFELPRSKVQGSVTFAGNDFRFSPESPVLQNAQGQLYFSETGFNLGKMNAQVYGGSVVLEGGVNTAVKAGESVLALRAQGEMTAEGLRSAEGLALVSRIATYASGQTSYSATIGLKHGAPDLRIHSDLLGLGLDLPAPFKKSATENMPLRFTSAATQSKPLQDNISVEIGEHRIAYWRDLSGSQAKVLRGRIGVGLMPGQEIAANEDPGVVASIAVPKIDAQAWLKVFEELSKPQTSNIKEKAPISPTNTAQSATENEALAFLPSIMSLRTDEISLEGRSLKNLVLGASRDNLTWRANLEANELEGYVEFRQPSAGNSGRVWARLTQLILADQAVKDIESSLEQPANSSINLPALDVVIEDLQIKGKSIGRVEIEAQNKAVSENLREWQLSKLDVILPEAKFSATGKWAAVSAENATDALKQTALDFTLDLADSGAVLKHFGQDKVIARGKGQMQGNIAWQGAPWALHPPSMAGKFSIDIESGRFLKADPGLAKLLGVLSLQALPRRLSLDFRDVFAEGFSFDFIKGDVQIEQGIAKTNNLQMKGVNAAVLMQGQANIGKETQDIKVVVVPEINAGTASVITAIINPVLGLSTFLAQWLLRYPLIEATTREFQISGTWTEPQIKPVSRQAIKKTDSVLVQP